MTPEERARQDASDVMSEFRGEAIMAEAKGEGFDLASLESCLVDLCLTIRNDARNEALEEAATKAEYIIKNTLVDRIPDAIRNLKTEPTP